MTESGPSLSDQAYDTVERMIVTLELPPGTVFSEGELSERVGIGRTPLREALQRLAGDRLVIALPRRGMMVTEINASDYFSLLDTRKVLDRLITEQAARRATPDERHRLRRVMDSIQLAAASENADAFMKADREGDEILEKACRNPYAWQATSALHAHCRRFWFMHKHYDEFKWSAELHATIMQSVVDGNVQQAGKASDALIIYLETFARKALDLE